MGMAGREHSGCVPLSLLKEGHLSVLAKFCYFPYRFSYKIWQENLSSKLYFFEKSSFKFESYYLIPFFFLSHMKDFQVLELQNYRITE